MNPSLSSFSSYSFSRPDLDLSLDLSKWIDSLRKSMEVHDDETTKTDVSIFNVPKTLLDTDPDSYIPEQIAFGPFHHWDQQVFGMQKYKLAAVRNVEKRRKVKFQRIVDDMKKENEARIRACYHKFLNINGDAIAWMMAIDMAFLLEFLQVYYIMENGESSNMDIGSRLPRVIDVSGKKLSHMAILRDVVKLENQIPLFLIKTEMETLQIMLRGLYHELSPFRYQIQPPLVDINKCDHILHFLYQMTVPADIRETPIEVGITEDHQEADGGAANKESFGNSSYVKKSVNYIWEFIKNAKCGFVKRIILRPIGVVTKLPLNMIFRLPIFKQLKQLVEHMWANLQSKTTEKPAEIGTSKSNPPVIEEITIPSVTKMAKSGILFKPVYGTISEIRFDETTSTLYLPIVHLDVNTEVYLRNLVAYEACVASGALVMARYTELMNGIIDTKEDAKVLMDCKIVFNHLRSEKEVADLWNGMSKSVKMTKVPFMDDVIEKVNDRYHRTWRVKLGKFMTKYVFGFWKLLTLLAAVFLLVLSTVQAVCSVYTCARVIRHIPVLDQPPE